MRSMRKALLIALVLLAPASLGAWKPLTHIYIANVVLEDAKDGKISIPPFGDFAVDPTYRRYLQNAPNALRAGAIGPDGFPDLVTGQMNIHAENTDVWLLHLKSLITDGSYSGNNPAGAFYVGYLIHCASDMWAHDWVNAFSGGSWPSAAELSSSRTKAFLKIKKHMAIENTVDEEMLKKNSSMSWAITVPEDYLFDVMINTRLAAYAKGPKYVFLEMTSPIQKFVTAYWRFKDKEHGQSMKNLAERKVYEYLDECLREWITTSATIFRRTIGGNEKLSKVLVEEYKSWALDHVTKLGTYLEVKDALAKFTDTVRILSGDPSVFLERLARKAIEELVTEIKTGIYDALMKPTVGFTYSDLGQLESNRARDVLEPAVMSQFTAELGEFPAVAAWPKVGPTSAQNKVNAAVYNSVVSAKLALLNADGLNQFANAVLNGSSGKTSKKYFLGTDFIPAGIASIDKSGQFLVGTAKVLYNLIGKQLYKTYARISVTPELDQPAAAESLRVRTFLLTIKTADTHAAGTDSDLYLVTTRRGREDRFLLDKSNYNDFEQNDQDDYLIEPEASGTPFLIRDISRMRIEVGRRAGTGPEWTCDWLTLRINGSLAMYHVKIGRTLANQGDFFNFVLKR